MASNENTGEGGNTPSLTTPNSRGWVSVRQFAALMEKDYRVCLKWIRQERVRSVRVGGQIRIFEDEVRYILENGTRPPKSVDHEEPGEST
jgi:hypothetical protein